MSEAPDLIISKEVREYKKYMGQVSPEKIVEKVVVENNFNVVRETVLEVVPQFKEVERIVEKIVVAGIVSLRTRNYQLERGFGGSAGKRCQKNL